jgi:hypothetical protein
MDKYASFEAMCNALGAEATDEQVLRLADHVREHFGRGEYHACAEIAISYDVSGLYTELGMLCGEAGA